MRERRPSALLLSLAVHAALVVAVLLVGPSRLRLPGGPSLVPVPEAPPPPQVAMIWLEPETPAAPAPAVRAPAAAGRAARRAVPPPAGPPAAAGRDGAGRGAPPDSGAGAAGAADSRPAGGTPGAIGPALADGALWQRPLPLPPRELAGRLTGSHAELADSAVEAIVQAFLDSVANDPATRDAAMPSWTREIGGKTYGLDGRYLYIAGLKIPAAVLALLPLPSTGSYDQALAARRLAEMRADLFRAAQRAENLEQFKRNIREIRERKEREEELRRNQRIPPEPQEDEATP